MQDLESLFERALDAVVGMDRQGRVTAWNTAAETIFGWRSAEALGADMGNLIIPPQHRAAHAKGLAHYNRTGEGPVLEKRVRITALHRDGTEFPVELSIFPMEADGHRRNFYAFIRSLAEEEQRRREQELRSREAEISLGVAQRLLEGDTLDEFTRFCLAEVCTVAGLDAGHLFLVRGPQDAQFLMPTGNWFIRDPRFQPVIDITQTCRFEMSDGLPGRAWQRNDLVVQQDVSQDLQFLRRDVFSRVGLTRGMALPIARGGEIRAVLEFFGTETSRFDEEIFRLVRTVGSQIGIALLGKEEAEHRETLRQEVMHRVSNSLAIVASIFRGCARRAETIEDLSEPFLSRIAAISRATRLSISQAEAGVPLGKLIGDAIELLPDREAVQVDAAEVRIKSHGVMPLTLILNELATNGLKYGGLAEDARLSIKAEICERTSEFRLSWQERLAAPRHHCPAAVKEAGFGSQLMKLMIEGRLAGRYTRQIDESGFRFELTVPGTISDQAIAEDLTPP